MNANVLPHVSARGGGLREHGPVGTAGRPRCSEEWDKQSERCCRAEKAGKEGGGKHLAAGAEISGEWCRLGRRRKFERDLVVASWLRSVTAR